MENDSENRLKLNEKQKQDIKKAKKRAHVQTLKDEKKELASLKNRELPEIKKDKYKEYIGYIEDTVQITMGDFIRTKERENNPTRPFTSQDKALAKALGDETTKTMDRLVDKAIEAVEKSDFALADKYVKELNKELKEVRKSFDPDNVKEQKKFSEKLDKKASKNQSIITKEDRDIELKDKIQADTIEKLDSTLRGTKFSDVKITLDKKETKLSTLLSKIVDDYKSRHDKKDQDNPSLEGLKEVLDIVKNTVSTYVNDEKTLKKLTKVLEQGVKVLEHSEKGDLKEALKTQKKMEGEIKTIPTKKENNSIAEQAERIIAKIKGVPYVTREQRNIELREKIQADIVDKLGSTLKGPKLNNVKVTLDEEKVKLITLDKEGTKLSDLFSKTMDDYKNIHDEKSKHNPDLVGLKEVLEIVKNVVPVNTEDKENVQQFTRSLENGVKAFEHAEKYEFKQALKVQQAASVSVSQKTQTDKENPVSQAKEMRKKLQSAKEEAAANLSATKTRVTGKTNGKFTDPDQLISDGPKVKQKPPSLYRQDSGRGYGSR